MPCHIRGSWEERPQNAPFFCNFCVNLKDSKVNSVLSKFTEEGNSQEVSGYGIMLLLSPSQVSPR